LEKAEYAPDEKGGKILMNYVFIELIFCEHP